MLKLVSLIFRLPNRFCKGSLKPYPPNKKPFGLTPNGLVYQAEIFAKRQPMAHRRLADILANP
ncbi:MAG: hypothetical protein ACFNLD_07945 [Kingella oralis]